MRIVGGRAKGRRLKVPPKHTRPTSERVREAVFSAVGHRLGGWEGLAVLDVYAGSGALGLEAWSRGADSVVAVDKDRRAVAAIKANAAALDATNAVTVVETDAAKLGPRAVVCPARPAADVAFLDPPYDHSDTALQGVLAVLQAGDWLADGCLAVVERSAQGEWVWPEGWESVTDRRYGDTRISLGVLVASETPAS